MKIKPKFKTGDEVSFNSINSPIDCGTIVSVVINKKHKPKYVVEGYQSYNDRSSCAKRGLYTFDEDKLILENWTKYLKNVKAIKE